MSDSKGAQWVPLQRDYAAEIGSIAVKSEPVRIHPLLSNLKEALKAESKAAAAAPGLGLETKEVKKAAVPDPLRSGGPAKASMDDPLRSAAVKAQPLDPLRAPASPSAAASGPLVSPSAKPRAEDSSSSSGGAREGKADGKEGGKEGKDSELLEGMTITAALEKDAKTEKKRARVPGEFESWKEKRVKVLQQYTTNKRMPVSANFLEDDKAPDAQNKPVDSRTRLEQLEMEQGETEEAKNLMTQKEYIAHIEEQHERLKNAWDSGERVVALKIAIQCAKLLGDTSVPQFYPSMYVLLTDILDSFGELVYQRIKRKGAIVSGTAGAKAASLPADFKAIDVSQQAKETCRNWFYKTACIRELMPRLYVDLALIKSYRFIEDGPYHEILARISRTVRGIGDPLAATYARAYVATKALDLAASFFATPPPPGYLPQQSFEGVLQAWDDFMFTFRAYKSNNWGDIGVVEGKKITLDEYIDLSAPAVEWMLTNIGHHAQTNEDLFYATCQQYKEYCNNASVLQHILGCFKPQLISKYALNMTTYIKEADENTQVPKSKLYLALGRSLILSQPPASQRLPILNDVWKVVTKVQNPDEYIEIAEVFVQYLLINFGEREVNIFLKDVIKHVKKDQAYTRLQGSLQTIVEKVMEHSRDLDSTLAMDNFLPVIDLLDKSTKVAASKAVLTAFASRKKGTISDPVIIHTLFDVSRSLHDSVDSMSYEDDRRQISHMIVGFIRKVDFGRDVEKQLQVYVDCRQAFTNLDQVTTELVLRVALLANKTHKLKKGKHTKKTAQFVKACLAYCHITIPSLDDIFARLRLLLQCAEVALTNQMIVQGEGFLQAAITLIPLVPAYREEYNKRVSTEDDLVSYLRSFAAFLLLFPGHPEHGPFYLVRGLFNYLQNYEAWKTGSQGKARVYMGLIALFSSYAQRNFPYHIEGVESNDSLYGGDAAYLAQVATFIETLVKETLSTLNEIGEAGDLMARKKQGTLAIELVNTLVSAVEMNQTSATTVVRLFQLAKKSDAVDAAFMRNTLAHIQAKRGSWYQDVAAKISSTTGITA